MDAIAKYESTAIPVILEPTMQVFTPLLEKNRSKIESVDRKSFKYGSTDRHQLDVYYPPLSSTTSKPPILVFHYGGGFYSGDRVFPPPRDLVYRNLGAFFATRGILTVIHDYRIIPDATYPDPASDSAVAIRWVVENLRDQGDVEKLVLMGHSAGAAIVATMLLHEPSLLSPDIKRKIKGAVLVGGPYHHNGPFSTAPGVLEQYYGTPEQIAARAPYALLQNASNDTIATIPRLLFVISENDSDLATVTTADFTQLALERIGETKVSSGMAKGHNHCSLNWALETGEGEEWAEDVAKWVKET